MGIRSGWIGCVERVALHQAYDLGRIRRSAGVNLRLFYHEDHP